MRKWKAIAAAALVVALPLAAGANVVVLNVPQIWQHKDTVMNCVAQPNPCGPVIHPWNHALAGCAHCSYYCVPAAIAMVCAYRGTTVPQDSIYDNGKSCCGEIQGNNKLDTHGVGMFDRSALAQGLPDEVHAGFLWARQPWSPVIYIWGPVSQGYPGLSLAYLERCIRDGIPVIWCDHGGWPSNMEPYPSQEIQEVSGHAKVIDGYNDNGTPQNTADDQFHIVDPWPSSGSPYWVAATALQDTLDVFYADFDPVPAEQTTWSAVKRLFR